MRSALSYIKKYRLMTGITTVCLLFGITIVVTMYFRAANQIRVLEQQSGTETASGTSLEPTKDTPVDKKKAEPTKAKETTTPQALPQTLPAHNSTGKVDIVVNKKHPLVPLSYTPPLVTANCAGYGSAMINPVAQNDFMALCKAARNAKLPLSTSSSYRSYQTQVSTYGHWVSVSGKAGADRYSARPGYSEHQTGLAVDFQVPGGASLSDFTGTPQQKWLAKNAWKYGWIQRYATSNTLTTGYQAESWHYRYIGKTYADTYTSTGAGSLEQLWGITGGDY